MVLATPHVSSTHNRICSIRFFTKIIITKLDFIYKIYPFYVFCYTHLPCLAKN